MSILTQLIVAFAACSIWMLCLWSFQLGRREADVVDFGWASAIGACATFFAIFGAGDLGRRVLLALLVFGWSARLSIYLLRNRVLKIGEDPRYAELRLKWGARAMFNFFILFQAQALLVVLLSAGFLVIASETGALGGFFDFTAILIWSISLIGESLADRQLNSFRADPANRAKTCDRGLWRYSRHPNYFFEWIHWLTYPLLASFSVYWPLTLIPIALMYYLLVHVTGVPPSEARALKSRGEDYQRYQQRTSMFVPWWTRKGVA